MHFWSLQMWKPPGLTAIPVPDSNIRAAETPPYHNHQRQVGFHRPMTLHHMVCGLTPPLKLPIWAEILVSSDVETSWLDSHPGPRL